MLYMAIMLPKDVKRARMELILTIFTVFACAGLMPAYIASRRGKNFLRWWIYGAALFPVAVIHLIVTGDLFPGTGRCPYCHNIASMKSEFCPKCGYDFRKVQ